MTEYENLLAGAERLEKMGGLQEALELLQKMKQIFPDQENEIVLRILNIMFLQERFEEALDSALEYIESDDGSIFQWILERYYEPYREESETIKKSNLKCLEQYDYFYGIDVKDDVKALLFDGCKKLIFCKGKMIRRQIGMSEICLKNNEIVLLSNVIAIADLVEQIHETKYKGPSLNYEEPVYLYYDEDVFEALLQCIEIGGLLNDRRAVLLVGETQLSRFFAQSQVIFPSELVGTNTKLLADILEYQQELKASQVKSDQACIREYYSSVKKEVDEHIQERRPRILFLTSYFTSVLQNHTRDLQRSAEKLGLDTMIYMEKGAIFVNHVNDYCAIFNSFRPDMIFCIDHFRFEIWAELPKEIVWVSWIQDPLQYVMSPSTPAKLGNSDFVLNHFTTWQEFRNVGYPAERMMDAPIPANQAIYKPYVLTAEEKENYSCDICFVCHASDVDAHIKEVVAKFSEEEQEAVASVYKGYQSYVYKTGEPWYQIQVFRQYIEGAFLQHYGLRLTDRVLDFLSEDMYLWFNQRVFREALVDWILDAGFTNIKLWGNGWKTNPKYEPYAMGPAENGETLSKIYQASKIVVGNNVMTTAAARAWETMLSGGFYLSNYIPKEADITDIRKILTVGEDVIMFYNRDDLIEKLHYYLEHENERKKMIEKGRKVALEKMTFDSLVKKMLEEVAVHI